MTSIPAAPLSRALRRPSSARRSSFLMELRDQLQYQYDGDPERERMREVTTIHRILEKPPESRESQDIDTLYEFVLQNGSTSTIFQGAQEIICKTICREMTLLELPPKGVVCYQGDYGDTFFIIIQGSVSLYIDSKRRATTQYEENGANNKSSDRYLQSMPTSKIPERVDSEGNPLPENFGAFIKQIGSGGTFGELAVMDPTARRSCTIICDSATSFICLKRGAYQRLIRITNSSHLDFTRVEYLETLFFFSQWPHGELTRLSNRMRHLNFSADTFLTRVGAEANVVFFIYSGIVQESIPLVHSLNSNGTVRKVSRLESSTSKRSLHESVSRHGMIGGGGNGASGKNLKQPQTKRIALELNVYQDHDICGEFPVLFNKNLCNTDLLAVTDVKTLIMDRETWKELFFMHGLEHIRDSYQKFRTLAESRENWRQTRTKLALSNPGLVLSLSTKVMMQDGKCICGWCGSKEHITGDPSCAVMVSSKKKQADKLKNSKNKAKRILEMTMRAQAVKNTLTFMHSVAATHQEEHRTQQDQQSSIQQQLTSTSDGSAPRLIARRPAPGSGHRVGLQVAAKSIVSDFTTSISASSNQEESVQNTAEATQTVGSLSPTTKAELSATAVQLPRLDQSSPIGSSHNLSHTPVPPAARKDAISGFKQLESASSKLYASEMQHLANPNAAATSTVKLEEVRKSMFPEQVESCYKETLVRKMKRLSTMQDYFNARTEVLETMREMETKPAAERAKVFEQTQPRKPKIPKPVRHLCSKGKQPRPDRFNRKINRMLKRLRLKEHPLPVMEESLQDF